MADRRETEKQLQYSLGADSPIPAARPMSDFAFEPLEAELVIFDVETLQYHTLNAAAAWIWQACDGVSTPNQLAQALDTPVEVVESTIAELGEAGLLQTSSDQWDSTLNRRRAAKLIAAGLAGVVGIPVIKSITAPDAASAASIGQCAFGFAAGAWLCGVCSFFSCGCEAVTSGGSGFCCVCGGAGLFAASGGGPSREAFFAAVNQAQSGKPLTWTDDSYEVVVESEPVDTTIDENVSAPAEIEEQIPATEVSAEVEAAPPVQEDIPAEPVDESGESVGTGSGEEEPVEPANG